MTARCVDCAHHPHPGRPCATKRVTGPAVNSPESISAVHYRHVGRVVTACGCPVYRPEINGATT